MDADGGPGQAGPSAAAAAPDRASPEGPASSGSVGGGAGSARSLAKSATAVAVMAVAVMAGATVLARETIRPAPLRMLSSRLSAIVMDQIGNRARGDPTAEPGVAVAVAGVFISGSRHVAQQRDQRVGQHGQ